MRAALWAVICGVAGGRVDMTRVMDELDRSLNRYDKYDGEDNYSKYEGGALEARGRRFLRRTLWDQKMNVLIFDGRVIVDRAFILNNTEDKVHQHLMFVASIIHELKIELPNSVYSLSFTSTGSSPNKHDTGLPTLVIAKQPETDGRERPGIMIPNPYFADLMDWHDFLAHLHSHARKRPFRDRIPRAFWRGAIRSYQFPDDRAHDCVVDHGNFARLQAASLTLSHPRLVDVQCKDMQMCRPRDDPRYCDDVKGAPPMPYNTAAIRRAAKHPELISNGSWTLQEDYADYKYLLNLPGSTHGSYSRNLNHLWSLGSVVLQWATRAVEWYYPALVDGENYVVVDGESLVPTVKRLQADPAEAHRLVQGARHVDKAFLCAECIADHFRRALEAVRDHWREDLVLDDPCALQAFLEDDETAAALGCDDLDLVEIVASYTNGLVSNVESWQNSYDKWTNPTPGRFKNMFHHSQMPREDKSAYGGWTHAVLDAKPLRGSGSSCARLANHARKRCPRAPEED